MSGDAGSTSAPKDQCYLGYMTYDLNDGEFLSDAAIYFELYKDAAPKTVQNFADLLECKAVGPDGKPDMSLCYRDTELHRIIPGFMMQGGDTTCGRVVTDANGKQTYPCTAGTGGKSIHGERFEDEEGALALKHTDLGTLSMANAGPDTNGSQFFITYEAAPHLDGKHGVFGHVIGGFESVWATQAFGQADGTPMQRIVVRNTGLVKETDAEGNVVKDADGNPVLKVVDCETIGRARGGARLDDETAAVDEDEEEAEAEAAEPAPAEEPVQQAAASTSASASGSEEAAYVEVEEYGADELLEGGVAALDLAGEPADL
eukprot:tig00000455_g1038.t1